MRAIIGASLAVLIVASGAAAQSPPPSPERPPRDAMMMEAPPRPPGPVKSARFRLQVGRISLGLTCPDDEPMKACEEFAMQLLDKAETMQKRPREGSEPAP